MKITIEFDENSKELAPVLKRLGVSGPKELEELLSENVLEALKSPYLRVKQHRKSVEEARANRLKVKV